MKRCYCGHNGGSFAGNRGCILKSVSHISSSSLPQQTKTNQRPNDLLSSVTSSSRPSSQPTQFVKRPNVRRNGNSGLGLGHSSSALCRDFSRRNSVTTSVSHCSSCCSSCGYAPQERESRVKVLSWANGPTIGTCHSNNSGNNNNSHCEHTENRRIYEQRACAASRLMAEGQGQVQTPTSSLSSPLPPSRSPSHRPSPSPDCNNDLQRLLALQQFRLLNASDCFSTRRQDELRLQRAYDKLSVADSAKWHKNMANETRQHCSMSATTPYALRQKLLQLRLQDEHATGRGTGAVCAPLDRSCALRYN